MANNFGDRYPGKTWKDACIEVAWNKITCRNMEMGVKYSPRHFGLGNSVDGIFIEYSFPAFRAAFMKWLKENERREG